MINRPHQIIRAWEATEHNKLKRQGSNANKITPSPLAVALQETYKSLDRASPTSFEIGWDEEWTGGAHAQYYHNF